MSKKQWFKTFIIVILVVLTSACSKKLLPPEIETVSDTGSMSDTGAGDAGGMEDTGSGSEGAASGSGALGGSDEPFAQEPQLERGGDTGPSSIFSESDVDASGNAIGGTGTGGLDSAGGDLSGSGSRGFGSGGNYEIPGDGYYGHYASDKTGGFEKNAEDIPTGSDHVASVGGDTGSGNNGGVGNGGDLPISDRRDFGSGSGVKEPGDGYYGHGVGTPLTPLTPPGSSSSNGDHHANAGDTGTGGVRGNQDSGLGAQIREGIQEARLLPFKSTADLKDVYFQFDKYGIDSGSLNVLRQNAGYLKKRPNVKVEIQGHCDERGTNNYNIALGERRANAIKRKLMSLGIEGKLLHTISYGEEKPFCFESSEACWRDNRRGHFMVSE